MPGPGSFTTGKSGTKENGPWYQVARSFTTGKSGTKEDGPWYQVRPGIYPEQTGTGTEEMVLGAGSFTTGKSGTKENGPWYQVQVLGRYYPETGNRNGMKWSWVLGPWSRVVTTR